LGFREFASQWVGLCYTSFTPVGFILCWHHQGNELLLLYGHIKSKAEFLAYIENGMQLRALAVKPFDNGASV